MNVILLSGGSGKRLWPLSNDVRSKQFLKLLRDENGQYQSMLQRVYGQLKQCPTVENIVIVTSETQKSSIKSQLEMPVDIIVEPTRRDTFPAIALSCAELLWKKKNPPESVVAILPVDLYAEQDFFETVQQAVNAVEQNQSELVLVGVKPTFPTEKYGYIIPKNRLDGGVLQVSRFQEKPSAETAKALIEQGALWNCGVFVCRLQYITDILENRLGIHSYEELLNGYSQLPKMSFDYAVVEKAEKVAVAVYDKVWKDIGTWNTLTEEMSESTMGNVTCGEETQNTQVINELGIPIVVLDAKNMVIAASPDGILVTDKEKSSYLKPYVDKLSQRPMFEERAWGEYKVLDYHQHSNGMFSLVKHLFIREGQSISYQRHLLRDEIWTVAEGTGDFVFDGNITGVRRGDVIQIKAGQKHAVHALSPLHIIEVQIGSELSEEDIIREPWQW